MKFLYRKEPVCPARRFADLLALVDSGADDCIFPVELAEDLNLPLDPERVMRYRGVGTGHITAHFADVTVDVGGTRFPLYARFSDGRASFPSRFITPPQRA